MKHTMLKYLQHKEVEKKVRSLDPINNDLLYTLDDIGNGLLFANTFGDVIRYNVDFRMWMYYDNQKWCEDRESVVAMQAGEALARVLYLLCVDGTKDQRLHYERLGSVSTRKRMLEDAIKHCSISAEMFDSRLKFINMMNGVYNLETHSLIDHDPELYLSKMMGVSYDPEARSPLWDKFISDIMQDDPDKIAFLKRVLGYSLLGTACEDKLFLLYGATTRNGKSTLCDTILSVFGDYGVFLPSAVLGTKTYNNPGSADENTSELKGARFCHMEEPSQSMRFDVALVKSWTGGTKIKARRLHQHNVTFGTTFTMFLACNYLPRVDDPTLFTSGRLCVIPFNRHFEEHEQDKSLKEKLKADKVKSAVFNWLIEGLKDYQKNGLNTPGVISSEVNQYAKASDKLMLFVNDELIRAPGKTIKAGVLYEKYKEWCFRCGNGTESYQHFNEILRRRGLMSERGTIAGKTVKNVIKDFRFREALDGDEQEDSSTDDKGFSETDDIPFG